MLGSVCSSWESMMTRIRVGGEAEYASCKEGGVELDNLNNLVISAYGFDHPFWNGYMLLSLVHTFAACCMRSL
jgi:hypothetical protein